MPPNCILLKLLLVLKYERSPALSHHHSSGISSGQDSFFTDIKLLHLPDVKPGLVRFEQKIQEWELASLYLRQLPEEAYTQNKDVSIQYQEYCTARDSIAENIFPGTPPRVK